MHSKAGHKRRMRDKVPRRRSRGDPRGGHKVGVAEVMAMVGLTAGGFYAHFEFKDGLVVRAIDRMFEKSATARIERTAGNPPQSWRARSNPVAARLVDHCNL